MNPSIIFTSAKIENFKILFQDFSREFIDLQLKNLDYPRSDQNQHRELDFDLYWHDKLNETFQVISEFYFRNIRLDLESEKNETLLKLSNNFGNNNFRRYREILDSKLRSLDSKKRELNQKNISILYLDGYNDILVCDILNPEDKRKIEHEIQSYIREYFDEKVQEFEFLFSSGSLSQLKNHGIQISKIVEEINEEKQLELEENILNNYWYLEYSVHFPVNDKNILKKLLKDDELDFNDFEIIGDHSLIKWHRTIDNDDNFIGHDFHPLMNDFDEKIKSKIKEVVTEEIYACIENGERVLEEILELCNYTYPIEISLCELDDSEHLTEKSLIF